MEFLRDPIWQFIGVIIALLVPLIVFWIQLSRKALVYEIISDVPILNVEKEVKGNLQILFNGKSANESHLVLLRLWNSGNVPVKLDDFDNNNPLKFQFGRDVEILNAEVVEGQPSILINRATLRFESNHVILDPLLLNPKDSIKIKLITSQPVTNIDIDVRISGIKNVNNSFDREIVKFIFAIVYVFIFFPIAFIYTDYTENLSTLRIVLLLILIMLLFILFDTFRKSKKTKKLWAYYKNKYISPEKPK